MPRAPSDFATGGDDNIFGGGGNDELWGDGELPTTPPAVPTRSSSPATSATTPSSTSARARTPSSSRASSQSDFQITIEGGTDTLLTSLGDDSLRLRGFTDPLVFGVDVIFA